MNNEQYMNQEQYIEHEVRLRLHDERFLLIEKSRNESLSSFEKRHNEEMKELKEMSKDIKKENENFHKEMISVRMWMKITNGLMAIVAFPILLKHFGLV